MTTVAQTTEIVKFNNQELLTLKLVKLFTQLFVQLLKVWEWNGVGSKKETIQP